MLFRPDAALARFLDALTTSGLLSTAELALYVADHPYEAVDDTAAYLAIEASFGGYARVPFSMWTAAAVVANVARAQAAGTVWTATGTGLPVQVWGVFALDAGGDLLFAEQDPAGPTLLSAAGNEYAYLPRWSDKNQT